MIDILNKHELNCANNASVRGFKCRSSGNTPHPNFKHLALPHVEMLSSRNERGEASLVSSKKTAFTLAEILITLGIIGIVAAMTLPSVINNAQNKQLETGLKRAYSLIGQALDLYQAENGERIKNGEFATQTLKPILMQYFKTAKDCGWGASRDAATTACVPNTTYLSPDGRKDYAQYKTYNGLSNINTALFDDGQFVLNDGSLILLENMSGSNIYISVDVNGYKKPPNRLGHDLFMFQIDEKGKLLPMGVSGTAYYSGNDDYCSMTSAHNMNGAGCTYNALTDKNFFKNLPK